MEEVVFIKQEKGGYSIEFFFPVKRLQEFFTLWKLKYSWGFHHILTWKTPLMDYGETTRFMVFEARSKYSHGIWDSSDHVVLKGKFALVGDDINPKYVPADWSEVLPVVELDKLGGVKWDKVLEGVDGADGAE